jgi:hypothetical protein
VYLLGTDCESKHMKTLRDSLAPASLRPCRTIPVPAFDRFDESLYLVENTSDLTLRCRGPYQSWGCAVTNHAMFYAGDVRRNLGYRSRNRASSRPSSTAQRT